MGTSGVDPHDVMLPAGVRMFLLYRNLFPPSWMGCWDLVSCLPMTPLAKWIGILPGMCIRGETLVSVYMYVCMCVCCMYVSDGNYVCMYVCMWVMVCVYACMHVSMLYVCMYVVCE